MQIHLLAAVLIAAAAASVAQADPCDKDRALTCSDMKAGEGRIHDCLIGRKDQIAPSCAHALARADELANSMITACEPEAHRWCAQYGPAGRTAVIDCLKSHKDEVSEHC